MFLQTVVGFELKERFEEGFLRKLVVDFVSQRDMAKLAAALVFGDKMGDIIDELVKNGKEIEAVYFATETGLTKRFSPVSLLKSNLRNSKKNATTILRNEDIILQLQRNPAPSAQHSPAARYSGQYKYGGQNVFEGPAAPYASAYGVPHSQSPAAVTQQHYSHPVDNMGAAGYWTSGAYGGQTSYGHMTMVLLHHLHTNLLHIPKSPEAVT
ncbi:hypothetical protein CRYUN_Cryun02cG0003900 [Craigia yunnanensis]